MKESPAPTVSATFTDGAGKCASPAAFTPQGPSAAAGDHHHGRTFRTAERQPAAGRVQRILARVEPFKVLIRGLDHVGE